MSDTDDEQTVGESIPRAWREEFDGLKSIRPDRVQETEGIENGPI